MNPEGGRVGRGTETLLKMAFVAGDGRKKINIDTVPADLETACSAVCALVATLQLSLYEITLFSVYLILRGRRTC